MKNWIQSAVAVGLGSLLALPAMATQSRINSLSAGGTTFGDLTSVGSPVFNEKLVTIRDSANILYFPQYLVAQPAQGSESKSPLLYGNSVEVDNATASTYGLMNVRYAMSDSVVLWLYGRRSPWAPVVNSPTLNNQTVGTAAGFTPGSPDPTNHQLGLGFGMKLGDSHRFGAALSIGGNSKVSPVNIPADPIKGTPAGLAATPNNDGNVLVDANIGFGTDIGDNTLDFGLDLRFGHFNNLQTQIGSQQQNYSFQPQGIFSLGLLAKGEFQLQQTARLIPYARVGYNSVSIDHFARPDDPCANDQQQALICNVGRKGTFSGTAVNLGADLALRPSDNVLIQPGAGLAYRSTYLKGNSTPQAYKLAPPEVDLEDSAQLVGFYGFSAEAQAFDWMVLRLGARQAVIRQSSANTIKTKQGENAQTNEAAESKVTNVLSTGVGFKLKEWTLDMNVNPSVFNNGVYAVTGNATPTFAYDFALNYKW